MVNQHEARHLQPQSGQAAVEFALTFPVLMIVLTAITGFAVLFYSYLTMELAVRQGTNSITHNPSQDVAAIETVVKNSMVTLDPSQVSISVSPSNPSVWVSGVQVSVSALYTVNVPLNPLGPIVFQAQSVMTIE
jgi:Flp pilus assembly protein TadG